MCECWLWREATPEKSCWGEVEICHETEDGTLIYACKGHFFVWWDDPNGDRYEHEKDTGGIDASLFLLDLRQ
jgi:hypothetical protein